MTTSVAGTVAGLVLPSRIGGVVSALSGDAQPVEHLGGLAVVLAVLVTANVVGTYATGAYVATETADVRRRVAETAILEPQRIGAADLVTRVLVDSRQPAAVLPLVTSITLAAGSAATGLVLLGLLDWVLVVGVVSGLALVLLMLRRLVDDLSVLFQRYRSAQADVGQRLLDAQSGAVSIRAAGTWEREVRRVLAPLSDVRAAGEDLWRTQGRFAWRSSVVVPGLLLVTVAVGGWSLAQARIDVGDYVAAIGYTYLVIGGLDGIEAAAALGAVRASRARLKGLLTDRPALPFRAVLRPPTSGEGALDVVLDRVTVVDGERRLLDDISLSVPAGDLVAITGPSGSGRSTLAAVIAGITVPSAGSVLVGGRPAQEATDGHGFRSAVLGHARPVMLGGDVAGLIGIGVDTGTAGHDVVREAARQAHLLHVVESLPEGFSTPLDELLLSGGELQRLAIAQALARGSRLLVLDDVTASLDAATEREVLAAVLATRGHSTLVVVTNRQAVLARADIVVRLESGRLVETVEAGAA